MTALSDPEDMNQQTETTARSPERGRKRSRADGAGCASPVEVEEDGRGASAARAGGAFRCLFHRTVLLSIARRARPKQHAPLRLIDKESLRCLDAGADGRQASVRLAAAAYYRDADSVDVLLRGAALLETVVYVPDFDQEEEPNRNAPLGYAVCGGSEDIVGALLRAGARVTGVEDGADEVVIGVVVRGDLVPPDMVLNNPPLHAASGCGHLGIVRMLLGAGAPVDGSLPRSRVTALMHASRNGHLDVVRELIRCGADVNAAAGSGTTAIMEASVTGHLDIVRELVRCGADVNVVSTYGLTALMHASLNGHLDVVRELIRCGADVNAATSYGWTALMRASSCGHLDIVRELIRCGADVHPADDDEGTTALTLAEAWNHDDVAALLRTARAST